MANSTYRATVNKILVLAGQAEISTDNAFNSDSGLGKPELQAKRFVDKVNRRLTRKARPRFNAREYTITTADGTNAYNLDTAISPEQLIQDSWYISTSGYGRTLTNLPYLDWRRRYPEGETTEGVPERWILLPFNGTNERVAFSPVPNGTYAVKHMAYQDPVALSSASDVIVWPPALEDLIWDYGWMYLELVLAEGKTAEVEALMDNLYDEIKQFTEGPEEEVKKLDLGISINPLGSVRRRSTRSAS